MSQNYDQLIQSYRDKVSGLLEELQTRFAELDRYVAEIESLQAKVRNYRQDFSTALSNVQAAAGDSTKPLAERMSGMVSEAPYVPSAASSAPQVETPEPKDDQFGSLKGIIGGDS